MKPVSKTAFYCCGVRMADAERKHPLCGDHYAKRFMDAEALALFEPFKVETNAQRGNAARHRMIDDHLRGALRDNPELTVITVGAGFDTRPYRLRGGNWLELDEPALISLKNQRLPVGECDNKLTRIAIDFASERLSDKLAPFQSSAQCLFVFEGVFMYLEQTVIAETLKCVRQAFPHHILICDLMRLAFLTKYSGSMRARVEQLGARIHVVDEPRAIFAQNGYRLLQSASIAARSVELSSPRWLRPLVRLLPRDIAEGYTVNVFAPDAMPVA